MINISTTLLILMALIKFAETALISCTLNNLPMTIHPMNSLFYIQMGNICYLLKTKVAIDKSILKTLNQEEYTELPMTNMIIHIQSGILGNIK
jgi:hypothetical protein